MWPFGRKREAPAASGPQPAPAPIVRREWAGLPPIQRAIGEHPLTAPSDRFSNDLVTHQDPSVSSDTMGHQVSAEAPAGIVLTLARPSGTRQDGPAMIHRPPVQRRAVEAAESVDEAESYEAAIPQTSPRAVDASAVPLVARVAETSASTTPSKRDTTHVPVAVQPLSESMPLITAPREVQPMPVAAAPRQSAAPAVETPHVQRMEVREVSPGPRLTLGQARRLGLGAPINRVAERAPVQRAADHADLPLAPEPAPAASAPAAAEETVQRAVADTPPTPAPPETKASEPHPVTTLTPMVSRAIESPAPAVASRLDLPLAPVQPHIDRDEETPVVAAAEAGLPSEAPERSTTGDAGAATITSAPVQRAVESAEAASPSSEQNESLRGLPQLDTPSTLPLRPIATTTAQRSMEATISAPASSSHVELPPVAPLVGLRPLHPTVSPQRSTDAAPAPGPFSMPLVSNTPRADTTADDVPSTHGDGDDAASPAPMATAPAVSVSTLAETQTIQRAPSSDGPMAFARRPASTPPALVLAQRSWSGGNQSSLTGIRPTATPPRNAPELPLAFMPASVQRANEEASAESPNWPGDAAEPVVQGAWTRATPSSTAPAPASAPTIGAQRAAAQAAPEVDLDALAGKLYDRIRSKLKAELLVDRERAGFLTDLR